jgi:predicted ATPase
VVVTGGPGAGKTALLELLRHAVCRHVHILPESAGVVFGGGFPREEDPACRRASQRAIFHVQRELEVVGDAHRPAIVLCDRGTVDGVAYWPGDPADFWASVHTDPRRELARYGAVIHLRTPSPGRGYNHRNPLRTESPEAAAEIDERILRAWSDHPRRFVIESSPRFVDKAMQAMEILHSELPECCSHAAELHR